MFRQSSTYIYVAIAIGLVCFLLIDKKIPGTREQEEAESRLFKLTPDEVTGVEINNVHGVFIFQKNNNHWEIKKPVAALADGALVDDIINQIAFAQPQRIIKIDNSDKEQANLKEWGLSPAAERVVIHTKDNKMYELFVGRKTAINDSVYARTSGRKNESVRIIPNLVKNALQKDLTDFRSRHVFDFEVQTVTRIDSRVVTLGTPAQESEVALKDDKWMLEKPLVARASEIDVVQGLLGKILALRVVDFVTDDPSNLSQYGLTSPSATLAVTIKPDTDMVLQIGGPVPAHPEQVYAQRLKSSAVFTLAKSEVDALFQSIPNVRDRHILPFEATAVTGLSYAFGNKKVQLHREKNLWNTVGDSEGRADIGRITNILGHLRQLETTPLLKDSITDPKPFGLDKPQGKIVLELSDRTLSLLIGKAENKLLYVRNSVEPFIYTVPDNSFDFLPATNLALRDLQVIRLNLKQIKTMTFTIDAKPFVVLTRSSGGTWDSNVKDHMVDSAKAETQASLFSELQAKSWLGPVQPAYGLAKPSLVISVESEKPAPTVLRIGAKLPDGSYAAQVEGQPLAFALSEGDFGLLNISSLQELPKVLSPAPTNEVPAAAVPPASGAGKTEKIKK